MSASSLRTLEVVPFSLRTSAMMPSSSRRWTLSSRWGRRRAPTGCEQANGDAITVLQAPDGLGGDDGAQVVAEEGHRKGWLPEQDVVDAIGQGVHVCDWRLGSPVQAPRVLEGDDVDGRAARRSHGEKERCRATRVRRAHQACGRGGRKAVAPSPEVVCGREVRHANPDSLFAHESLLWRPSGCQLFSRRNCAVERVCQVDRRHSEVTFTCGARLLDHAWGRPGGLGSSLSDFSPSTCSYAACSAAWRC